MFDIFNDFTNNTIISLPHELRAIYITNYIKNINKNIVVVTNSLFEANKLHDTIQNYYNETLLFPMDDFLTSEAIAVSPELKTKRLETLEDLLYAKKPRIIVPLNFSSLPLSPFLTVFVFLSLFTPHSVFFPSFFHSLSVFPFSFSLLFFLPSLFL